MSTNQKHTGPHCIVWLLFVLQSISETSRGRGQVNEVIMALLHWRLVTCCAPKQGHILSYL